MAWGLLLGALSWSLLEYCIHRWLGHHPALRSRNLFGTEHTAHHKKPAYQSPLWLKGLAALGFAAITGPVAWWVAGSAGVAWLVGLLVAYGAYEVLHSLEHLWEGIGPYSRWARAHHFHHHFHNPASNHGVTSPVWDVVFGTYEAPAVIEVPRSLAMRWVVDPATGEVWPHLRGRYALRGRPARST
jgi:sterol desaturase/sphingolipid hydroxylase (fatty acid hydroxylase superfamily)